MKNRIVVTIIILFTLFFCTTFILAKRVGPTRVEDIIFNGIKYSATNEEMGYVEAWNIQNNKQIWKKKIYEVTYDNHLEKDVQNVYITDLRIEDNKLFVTNEKGEIYKINLKTGDNVINQENKGKDKQPIRILFISIAVIALLIFVIKLLCFQRSGI